jgi:hypothetical protein
MNDETRPGIAAPHQARTRAEAFLREHVKCTVNAGKLTALAREAGIRKSTLALARYALGIVTWKEWGRPQGRWFWEPSSTT